MLPSGYDKWRVEGNSCKCSHCGGRYREFEGHECPPPEEPDDECFCGAVDRWSWAHDERGQPLEHFECMKCGRQPIESAETRTYRRARKDHPDSFRRGVVIKAGEVYLETLRKSWVPGGETCDRLRWRRALGHQPDAERLYAEQLERRRGTR